MNGGTYTYIDRVMKVMTTGTMHQKVPAVVCSRTLWLQSSTFHLIVMTVVKLTLRFRLAHLFSAELMLSSSRWA